MAEESPWYATSAGSTALAVSTLMPQLQGGPRAARGDPLDLRRRATRSHACAAARGVRGRRELLRDAGVRTSIPLELPGTAPVVTGEIPAPPGAPTVLLYSHYDVVPAGDESKWESPPFEATERDGAIYGRGTADSKSNMLMHVGALRAWEGRPPVGIKVVIEGQEEVGGALEHVPAVAARAVRRGRDGDRRHGQRPAGRADADGRAARHGDGDGRGCGRSPAPKHSGQFGGAAPDALIVLLHALASLHDENGDVAVAGPAARGVDRRRPTATRSSASSPRSRPGCRCSAPAGSASGSGRARRSRSPASTCCRSTTRSTPSSPHARAKINLRVHPEQDAAEAQAALVRHLEALRPFGIALDGARARRPATASRPRRPGRPTRRRARRSRARGAAQTVTRRARRLDPARQRAAGGGARRRDAAGRGDRRLREHPRAERARPARRAREGGHGRGRVLRRATRPPGEALREQRGAGRGERPSTRSSSGCSTDRARSATRCRTRRSSSSCSAAA